MLTDVLADEPRDGLRWSACIVDVGSGESLAESSAGRVLSTASVGKLLLLIELARRFHAGELDPSARVGRGDDRVADSGLWQVLDASSLTLADAARLVGAVSDNLAANRLLDIVGLDAVARSAAALGLHDTALLDRVRDERGPQHPSAPSRGSAAELASLAAGLQRGTSIDAAVCADVIGWLSLGTDLSMVASAFGLDPLAHREVDRGVRLWNKTGTDTTVRADVGVVATADRALAYAVLAEWSPHADPAVRDRALDAMRECGRRLRSELAPRRSTGSRSRPSTRSRL